MDEILTAAAGAIKGIILINFLEACGYKFLDVKEVPNKKDELWLKVKLPEPGAK